MKGHNLWSYAPYKPLLRNVGDIYVCRIVPSENAIHFEWLDIGETEYSVFYRVRNSGEFICCGKTKGTEFNIVNLETNTDFEFYVCSCEKNSLIRLARTGKTVGTVVNYLHPDDEAYSFSGRYLCSPSLVRHPDGFLLASMDLFAPNHPQNLTLIFRSDDDGKSWYYVSELMPCFWGKMFIHRDELYMLACSTEYGDLVIGKSTDGGRTFSEPICLLRGSNGKDRTEGVHKNPQNLLIHNSRIYSTLEWGSYKNLEYGHAAMVMSSSVDSDLLKPESWTFTEPKIFENFVPEIATLPKGTVPIEGTLVLSADGRLLNIMRLCSYFLPMTIADSESDIAKFVLKGCAIAYEVDMENHGAPLSFSHVISLATFSKFMIKYDNVSKKYYSLVSRVHNKTKCRARNVLSLFSSNDLKEFSLVTDILDYSDGDSSKIGFQYVDFEIEGDDIIFLSRTALNNANNYHDANYSTFHRIKNFRNI